MTEKKSKVIGEPRGLPRFKVTGRMENVAHHELRAMVEAAMTVLSYHNFPLSGVKVRVCDLSEAKIFGDADGSTNTIRIARVIPSHEQALTVVLHEMIHLTATKGMTRDKREWATSTLTCRLKPTVTVIYNALIDGVWERAAYIAHRHISYKPGGYKDSYNPAEWTETGVKAWKKNGENGLQEVRLVGDVDKKGAFP